MEFNWPLFWHALGYCFGAAVLAWLLGAIVRVFRVVSSSPF